MGCGWEWTSLIGLHKVSSRLTYLLILCVFLICSCFLNIKTALIFALFWWIYASFLVLIYPKLSQAWSNGIAVRSIMGLFTLGLCWLSLLFLRSSGNGQYLVLFLFVLIWGADSGAYFAGKKWGKTPLLPNVSPGKTREGLLGALLTTLIITIVCLLLSKDKTVSWAYIILLAEVTVLFSIMGDLFESMLKRKMNLKDSGKLLPGHGGLLDRIDSLTAAAPIFALGLLLLEKNIY
jgi:phosphatidate cytidylyltransferase